MWWQRRALLWAFIKRDLRERFVGSFLGPLTLLLQPLAQILVFVFLFKFVFQVRIHLAGNREEDFLRFFLVGFLPWSIHTEALIRGSHSLLAQGHLLTKAVFPAEILPASAVTASYLLGIPILAALALVLALIGEGPGPQVLFFLLWLGVQYFFTLGIVFFLAALSVYWRDLQQFLGLLTMVWFYATPILYSMEMVPSSIRFFLLVNPFTYFVKGWQTVFLGLPISFKDFLIASLSSVFALLWGVWFFKKCRQGFPDVL